MNVWKQNLVPMLFAFASVASLIPAVVGPVIKGKPLNYTFLAVAIMFFSVAIVFFAVGRTSGGGSGPPLPIGISSSEASCARSRSSKRLTVEST